MSFQLAMLGFGEVGYYWSKGLRAREFPAENLRVYYRPRIPEKTERARARAAALGITLSDDLGAVLRGVDVIASVVTPPSALSVWREARPFLQPGQIFVDLNSARPATKELMSRQAAAHGVDFVDVAIMAGPQLFGERFEQMASGPGTTRYREVLEPWGGNVGWISDQAGASATLKMMRSVVMKGLCALLTEAALATEARNLTPALVETVHRYFEAVGGFRGVMTRLVPSSMEHAGRRAREMDEVIGLLKESGSPTIMTRSTRRFLERMAAVEGPWRYDPPRDLETAVSQLHQAWGSGELQRHAR